MLVKAMLSTLDERLRIPGTEPIIQFDAAPGGTKEGDTPLMETKRGDPQVAGVAIIGGRSVSLASFPNTRTAERYRGKNADGAVVAALPVEIPPQSWQSEYTVEGKKTVHTEEGADEFFRKLVQNTDSSAKPILRELRQALPHAQNARLDELVRSGQMTYKEAVIKRQEILDQVKKEFKGGAVASFAMYDPRHDALRIHTKGDCPVYLHFTDGEKSVALQINEEHVDPEKPHAVTRTLGDGEMFAAAVLPNAYAACLTVEPYDGNVVHVKALAAKIAGEAGLDPHKTSVTLALTSDGFPKHGLGIPENAEKSKSNAKVAEAFSTALHSDNPAQTLANLETTFGETDDRTVVVVPLNASGQEPIVAMVADGFYAEGQRFARGAVHAFRRAVELAEEKVALMRAARNRLSEDSEEVMKAMLYRPTNTLQVDALHGLGARKLRDNI